MIIQTTQNHLNVIKKKFKRKLGIIVEFIKENQIRVKEVI